MKDIWIKRTDKGTMLNLKGLAQIRKRITTYSSEPKPTYMLIFEWAKDSSTWYFDSEEELLNFHEHIITLLAPLDIDPKQKPLKL